MTERAAGEKRRDWRTQLTSFLLGSASGMATNLFSGATAYRAIVASVTLAGILMATTRLRTMPSRAPIVRYGRRLMLLLGALAASAAAVGPPRLAPYMTFCAVALAGGAILISDDPIDRLRLMLGVAAAGVGVGLVGLGIADLLHNEPAAGALVIGATAVVTWVVVTGVAKAPTQPPTPTIVVGLGGGVVLGSIVVAVIELVRGDAGGLLLVGFGLAAGGALAAYIVGRRLLYATAAVCLGLVVVGNAVTSLIHHRLLLSAAGAGEGIAMVGIGVLAAIRTDAGIRAISWLTSLAQEPDQSRQRPTGTSSMGEHP